jgi:ABC-type polysaccharide/polyol phosphate export permease
MEHLKAVWAFRHFWMSLVRMDLRSRYRRSTLGLGWSLLNPILMTAVYCLVFGSILSGGNWRTYAPFLLGGMAVWEFIRSSLLQGCHALARNESYIRQCPLPYGIYPLRTVLGTAIHFGITLIVVVVLVGALQGSLAVVQAIPTIVPGLLLALIFCWSIATIAAFATVYFHDTQHLVEVVAQLWFFLTPIIYERTILDNKGLGWLVDLNPVHPFLQLIRDPLLTGVAPSMAVLLQGTALTAVTFGLAAGTIAWLQKKIIFQM